MDNRWSLLLIGILLGRFAWPWAEQLYYRYVRGI
jgi:hypothetical protein